MNWGEASFERLVAAEPEPLEPHLQLTAAMLINVIARGGDVFANVRSLVFDNHEPRRAQVRARPARARRSSARCVAAGVVEVDRGRRSRRGRGADIRLTVDLQPNFALNQPLSPFALAAIELLDPDDAPDAAGTGHYALDVVSVIEATLDDPRPVLSQQQFLARGEAVAAMKREGIEYDQRMELLEEVTYPKPLDELLEQSFEVFASSQPWVRDFELSPKSVVRDMFERALSFARVHLVLPARPQRGPRAALPERRVPRDPPDGADRGADRRAARPHRVARRARAAGRLEPGRRVGEPHQPGRATRRAPVVPPAPPSVLTNRRAFLGARAQRAVPPRAARRAASATTSSPSSTPTSTGPPRSTRYFDEHDEMLTGGPAPVAAARRRSTRRMPRHPASGRSSRRSTTRPATTTGASAPRSTSPRRRRRAPRSCASPRWCGSDSPRRGDSCAFARLDRALVLM